jgi:HAD superfamily hydrolase (TIGR01509 family)
MPVARKENAYRGERSIIRDEGRRPGTGEPTRALHHASYISAARQFGLKISEGFTDEIRGRSVPDVCGYLKRNYGLSVDLEEFRAAKVRWFLELLPESIAQGDVRLRPGIKEAIASVEAKQAPWGIATNGITQEVSAIIDGVGLRPQIVVTRDDVQRGKPEPEIYILGAEPLKIEPSNCIALEDTTVGAIAAARAGMWVGYRPEEGFPNAFCALRATIRPFKPELRAAYPGRTLFRKAFPGRRQFIRIAPKESPLKRVDKFYHGKRNWSSLTVYRSLLPVVSSSGTKARMPGKRR